MPDAIGDGLAALQRYRNGDAKLFARSEIVGEIEVGMIGRDVDKPRKFQLFMVLSASNRPGPPCLHPSNAAYHADALNRAAAGFGHLAPVEASILAIG
ncbi:MAG: hypothetical protein ABI240_05335 [Sphingomonas sp.]